MSIRFRYGHAVAWLRRERATGQLYVGNLFHSSALGQRFKSGNLFVVKAVGHEGPVPTVDVLPVAFSAS